MSTCYYCQSDATTCCEEKIASAAGQKRTCPRAVCDKHAKLVDGAWKCLGHSLPPDTVRPWEKP